MPFLGIYGISVQSTQWKTFYLFQVSKHQQLGTALFFSSQFPVAVPMHKHLAMLLKWEHAAYSTSVLMH